MTDRADEIAAYADRIYAGSGELVNMKLAALIRAYGDAYGDEREREAFEAGVQAGMSYENALWQPPAGEDPPFPIYDDWATVARSVAPKERP